MRAMLTLRAGGASRGKVRRSAILLVPMVLSGCVQVTAPDKPIEINLNVNVKQEVLVKLQRDAQDIIDNNPELFPK
ncbi:YnbE family lipoprotein [Sphingomonas tabacisoli]|uniref:YnbE family lipoprotein n=1 Tax=Sphingomonas tabacisoli TaxID=2249466 RepID=A0ABW4I4P4_9SPHN